MDMVTFIKVYRVVFLAVKKHGDNHHNLPHLMSQQLVLNKRKNTSSGRPVAATDTHSRAHFFSAAVVVFLRHTHLTHCAHFSTFTVQGRIEKSCHQVIRRWLALPECDYHFHFHELTLLRPVSLNLYICVINPAIVWQYDVAPNKHRPWRRMMDRKVPSIDATEFVRELEDEEAVGEALDCSIWRERPRYTRWRVRVPGPGGKDMNNSHKCFLEQRRGVASETVPAWYRRKKKNALRRELNQTTAKWECNTHLWNALEQRAQNWWWCGVARNQRGRAAPNTVKGWSRTYASAMSARGAGVATAWVAAGTTGKGTAWRIQSMLLAYELQARSWVLPGCDTPQWQFAELSTQCATMVRYEAGAWRGVCRQQIDHWASRLLRIWSRRWIQMLATSLLVLRALFTLMVGGCSRFGIGKILTSNSAWVRLAVTLEIGVRCSITLRQSSCIPLSQNISQVKCWKERLRWIVFDRTAILFSERVSNCTNTLYFGEFSKYFCTPQFWIYPGRTELLLASDGCTSGSRLWITRTACPSWDSSSQNQSTLDDRVHVVSVPDVVDVLGEVIRQQHIVLQCRIYESTSWMSLDCSEIHEMFRIMRVQAILKLFFCPPPSAKKLIQAWILLLHLLHDELTRHVAVI